MERECVCEREVVERMSERERESICAKQRGD